jgi:hypothetical protein
MLVKSPSGIEKTFGDGADLDKIVLTVWDPDAARSARRVDQPTSSTSSSSEEVAPLVS